MWNDMVRFRTKLYDKLELTEDIYISLFNASPLGDSELGGFSINPTEIRVAATYTEKLPEP
jgi:hypothetical protein